MVERKPSDWHCHCEAFPIALPVAAAKVGEHRYDLRIAFCTVLFDRIADLVTSHRYAISAFFCAHFSSCSGQIGNHSIRRDYPSCLISGLVSELVSKNASYDLEEVLKTRNLGALEVSELGFGYLEPGHQLWPSSTAIDGAIKVIT